MESTEDNRVPTRSDNSFTRLNTHNAIIHSRNNTSQQNITQENDHGTVATIEAFSRNNPDIIGPTPKEKRRTLEKIRNFNQCDIWFRKHKLHNWNESKQRLKLIISNGIEITEKLYKYAVIVLRWTPLHVIKQFLNIAVISVIILLIMSASNSSISILCIISLIIMSAYLPIQNLYFFFLKDVACLQKVCNSKKETKHAIILFFLLFGISYAVLIFYIIAYSMNDSGRNSKLYGILLICVITIQIIIDTLIIHVLCSIIMVFAIASAIVLSVLYLIFYIVYLTFCLKCQEISQGDAKERKKEIIEKMLEDMSINYCQRVNAKCCSICLGDYKDNDIVIILDCSSGHVFHKSCLFDWLLGANLCPVCRVPPLPEEIYLLDL